MLGIGGLEQFDGGAVLDDECDADTVGWAVRRNQDFAASKSRKRDLDAGHILGRRSMTTCRSEASAGFGQPFQFNFASRIDNLDGHLHLLRGCEES